MIRTNKLIKPSSLLYVNTHLSFMFILVSYIDTFIKYKRVISPL